MLVGAPRRVGERGWKLGCKDLRGLYSAAVSVPGSAYVQRKSVPAAVHVWICLLFTESLRNRQLIQCKRGQVQRCLHGDSRSRRRSAQPWFPLLTRGGTGPADRFGKHRIGFNNSFPALYGDGLEREAGVCGSPSALKAVGPSCPVPECSTEPRVAKHKGLLYKEPNALGPALALLKRH